MSSSYGPRLQVRTVSAALAQGLLHQLHVALVPVLLGTGEPVFDGTLEGYEVTRSESSPRVLHVTVSRRAT